MRKTTFLTLLLNLVSFEQFYMWYTFMPPVAVFRTQFATAVTFLAVLLALSCAIEETVRIYHGDE